MRMNGFTCCSVVTLAFVCMKPWGLGTVQAMQTVWNCVFCCGGERQGHFVCNWTWPTAALGKKLHKSLFGTGSGQWWTQCRAWMGVFFTGWLGHSWLIRWQGRTTAVLQSHLWCHWWLIGWFGMNEQLAFAVSDHHILMAWTWSNRDNLLTQVTQSVCLHRYYVRDPHLFFTSSQLEDTITYRTSQHW